MADDDIVEIYAKLKTEGVDEGIEALRAKFRDMGDDIDELAGGGGGGGGGFDKIAMLVGAGGVIAAGVGIIVGGMREIVSATHEYEDGLAKSLGHIERHKVAAEEFGLTLGDIKRKVGQELGIGGGEGGPENAGFWSRWIGQMGAGGGLISADETPEQYQRRQRRELQLQADLEKRLEPLAKKQQKQYLESHPMEDPEFVKKMEADMERTRQKSAEFDRKELEEWLRSEERKEAEKQRERDRLDREIGSAEERRAGGEFREGRRREMAGLERPAADRGRPAAIESFEAVFNRIQSAVAGSRGADPEAERKDFERRREELRERWHKEDMAKQDEMIEALKKKREGLG